MATRIYDHFLNGKQKRVKRIPAIDGMAIDDFIMNNADPIFLHQNQMRENMDLPEDDVIGGDDEKTD
jgi:hypothetical protein